MKTEPCTCHGPLAEDPCDHSMGGVMDCPRHSPEARLTRWTEGPALAGERAYTAYVGVRDEADGILDTEEIDVWASSRDVAAQRVEKVLAAWYDEDLEVEAIYERSGGVTFA